MRHGFALLALRLTSRLAASALTAAVITSLLALAVAVPSARAAQAGPAIRPIVFVHGFFGSGSQFDSQAKRFASNGYPADYIESQDYDSTGINDSDKSLFTKLDQRIAQLKTRTGADQVDLIGHSLGTMKLQQYLNSSTQRASQVAHYVNVDGFVPDPAVLPGGVQTLAIWGDNNQSKVFPGAKSIYQPDESHVATVVNETSFAEMYKFFTGKAPTTTKVVATKGPVQLAGRVVSFPSNVGMKDARLDVYPVSATTGQRLVATPIATFSLSGDGNFGPFTGSSTVHYEFVVSKNSGGRVNHVYFEPTRRSDLNLRVLTTDPNTGVDLFINHDQKSSSVIVYRNKEWWGDQGEAVKINGTNVVNANTAPRSKQALAVVTFDGWGDGRSAATSTFGPLGALPALTAVDLFIPASPVIRGTSSGKVTIDAINRGGGAGTTHRVVVPNWPSSDHVSTVVLNDYVQP